MIHFLSRMLDQLSDFLAPRKGLLPTIGLLLVILNLIVVQFTSGWIASSNFLLHLGIVIAILGFMLARAL